MCGSGFHWEVGAGARLGVFAYMEQLPQKKKKHFMGKSWSTCELLGLTELARSIEFDWVLPVQLTKRFCKLSSPLHRPGRSDFRNIG